LDVHPQGTIQPAVSPDTTSVAVADCNAALGPVVPVDRVLSDVVVHSHHAPIPAPIAVAATDRPIFALSAGDFTGRKEGFTGSIHDSLERR
jgi:hypothetical protein